MLLVHSAGNTGAQWDALAAFLENDFRLIAPDLYDCGATSAWKQDRPMGYDDVAALFSPLFRQRDKVHLVGHSFGGGVALRLAAAHREKIGTLTLIEPGGYQMLREVGREDLWSEFVEVKDRFKESASRGDYDGAWQPFFDYYCSHSVPWRMLAETTRQSIMGRTPAQLRVYAAQETNPTRLCDIERFAFPTLVIHGELTTRPELGVCEVIEANARSSYGARVPGAGHMVPLSHPREVADRIREHIRRA